MAGNGEGSGEAKHTAKRTKTKESDEEVYLGPTNFGQGVLHDLSIEEAEECFIKREPLLCDKKDDVDDVVANKEGWTRALMSSFDKLLSAVTIASDEPCTSAFTTTGNSTIVLVRLANIASRLGGPVTVRFSVAFSWRYCATSRARASFSTTVR